MRQKKIYVDAEFHKLMKKKAADYDIPIIKFSSILAERGDELFDMLPPIKKRGRDGGFVL